jgi:hypothetical protein
MGIKESLCPWPPLICCASRLPTAMVANVMWLILKVTNHTQHPRFLRSIHKTPLQTIQKIIPQSGAHIFLKYNFCKSESSYNHIHIISIDQQLMSHFISISPGFPTSYQLKIAKMADSKMNSANSAPVIVNNSEKWSDILCFSCAELDLELEKTRIELRATQQLNKTKLTEAMQDEFGQVWTVLSAWNLETNYNICSLS